MLSTGVSDPATRPRRKRPRGA